MAESEELTMGKKTILTALALVGGMASANAVGAPTASDTWVTIRADRDMVVVQPRFVGAFGEAGIFNVCSDGAYLRTIRPVETCTNFSLVDDDHEGVTETKFVCTNYELKHVRINRETTEDVCIRYAPASNHEEHVGKCVVMEERPVIYPNTFELEVRHFTHGEDSVGTPLFTKPYTIPDCT